MTAGGELVLWDAESGADFSLLPGRKEHGVKVAIGHSGVSTLRVVRVNNGPKPWAKHAEGGIEVDFGLRALELADNTE